MNDDSQPPVQPWEARGALSGLTPDDPVLAVGAHFDDIELGCGGALAQAAARGCSVTLLVLTHSAYRHTETGVHRSAETALHDGQAAARALGASEVRCLGLPNMDLAWGSECVGAIEEVLNELNPTLIFTHWAFDTHQDHHHGAMSTLSAARYFGNILMYDPLFPSGRSYHPFRPQVYIDITETIERKMDALRCHLSEHRKYGDGWLEAVRARARFRGYETGVAYAEAFEVVRLRLAI